MCQKTNTMKRFFVLLNHPAPLQKPYVLRVIKPSSHSDNLFETSRNTFFLTKKEIESLGVIPPPLLRAYLLELQIPRDWFIH